LHPVKLDVVAMQTRQAGQTRFSSLKGKGRTMHRHEPATPDEAADRPLLHRRELLQGAIGAGLLTGSRRLTAQERPASTQPNRTAIREENQRTGTTDWMLSKPRIDPKTLYRCPWIEGYASRTSVRAGETFDVMVSTNPPSRFTVDLYRLGYYGGRGGRHVATLGPFEGNIQPDPPVGVERLRECAWPAATSITVPGDWLSGVYLGKLTALRSGIQSYIVFIVRDDRPADFLFQCSDTTWNAYNRWPDHYALYDDGKKPWYVGPHVRVSFDRPYGKYCQVVDAPLSTGSGEFLLWEFPFAYWMERHGYDVTYVSKIDTQTDPAGLRRGKGLLCVGHDEYWTLEMFQHVQAAVAAGTSVGFFSGDTCWGRIAMFPNHRGDPLRAISRIDHFGSKDAVSAKAYPEILDFPHQAPDQSTLIGARDTYPITGGGDWICVADDHWLFAGTGMKNGDRIPGLVGWEWEGTPADIPGLRVLATGPTDNGSAKGTYTATIYPGPRGNVVFNASTIWWGDGLAAPPGYVRPKVYTEPQGPDKRVQRITHNLLERMRG